MPQVIPALVYAVAGTSVVATIAAIALQALVMRALVKVPKRGALPINVTVRSTVASRQILFGKVRAGGSMLDYGCSGSNNKYLWYVIAYAGHQTQQAYDGYLDKLKIPAADINNSTGAVATAALDGKLMWWTHRGTQAQTTDSNLSSAFPAWTSNHRCRGISYDVLRLERSDKAWPHGAPQMANRVIEGALLYDPRLDSTRGGSGSHRTNDPSTWAYSRNLALAIRWFLTGGSVVNDQSSTLVMYGLRETDDRIDEPFWIAAANKCDESLSGGNAPPSGAHARYTIDCEFSCEQSRRDIIETMLMCGADARLINIHGKWRLFVAAYDSPVHAFTQDDLHGDLEIDDTSGEEDRFNTASGLYIDADRDYTEQTSKQRTDSAYVTQDGGKEITREIPMKGINNEYRAQRISEVLLRQSRQMRTIKMRLGRQGLKVAPWETFTMDHSKYGWSGRVFRCLEREVWRDDGAMGALITARAENSAVHTDLATGDYSTGTSVTNALQSETPEAPTSLAATPAVRAIEFTWSLGEFWRLHGTVELYEHTAQTPFSSAVKIWEGRGTRASIPKSDTTTRYYWIRIATINGEVSTTEPATNGLPAVALPAIDIVSDPEFVLATDTTYWWKYNPSGGAAATISLSGGALGGYASMTGAGLTTPVYIVSRRPLPVQCARGEIYTLTIRTRIPSAFSGLVFANVIRHARDYSNGTFDPTPASGLAAVALGGLSIDSAEIGSDWTEFVGLCFVRDVPSIAGNDLPRLSALVGTVLATSGAVEVDYVSVQPGENAPPRNKEYTGTADLASSASEYLHNLQYNSTSSGTITLPFAEAEHIGARIYFEQVNTGLLTIAAQSGDTLQSSPNTTGNRALAGRYARAYAEVVSSSAWRLVGDL